MNRLQSSDATAAAKIASGKATSMEAATTWVSKETALFYTLILLSAGIGVGLDFVGINPVKALYWTAVINGLVAPFLTRRFGQETDAGSAKSRLGWSVVAITTVAMFAAGVAVFVV